MSNLSTPHHPWCDESECSTRQDGQLVHRSAGETFDLNNNRWLTASMLTVHLVETSEGIEVGLAIQGAVTTAISATLLPEAAAELGGALLDHAERALGHSMSDERGPVMNTSSPDRRLRLVGTLRSGGELTEAERDLLIELLYEAPIRNSECPSCVRARGAYDRFLSA